MSDKAVPRLVAIPPAGGSSTFFAPLARHLAPSLRLCPLDLSGHGRRRDAPLLHDIPAMARDVLPHIRSRLDAPYALLGHSMGALVAHELVEALAAAQLPLPYHLFVSGCAAPDRIRLAPGISRLPVEDFWRHLAGLGGLPDHFFESPALMRYFEPLFRADFEAVTAYRPRRAPTPRPLPLTVLYGRDDTIGFDRLAAWQTYSTFPVSIEGFTGGHFFLLDHLPRLAAILAAATPFEPAKREGRSGSPIRSETDAQ